MSLKSSQPIQNQQPSKGGGASAPFFMHELKFSPVNCITDSELRDNVRHACKATPRSIQRAEAHDKKVVMVGGGPSLHKAIGEIRCEQLLGAEVWAVNEVSLFLKERGVAPDVCLICDPTHYLERCLLPESRHYIASRCNKEVIDKADGWLWHLSGEGVEDILNDFGDDWFAVGGGNTCILRGMSLAFMMGFRDIEMHGMDSSLTDDKTHAYEKAVNSSSVDVIAGGKKFASTAGLAMQAHFFQAQFRQLTDLGCKVTVMGDGLLPHIYNQMSPKGEGA